MNDIDVIVFEPNSAPVTTKSRDVPTMSPGRAALVVLMYRYLGGLMDPFVTLHDAGAAVLRRLGIRSWARATYPAAFDLWPAVLGFGVFFVRRER